MAGASHRNAPLHGDAKSLDKEFHPGVVEAIHQGLAQPRSGPRRAGFMARFHGETWETCGTILEKCGLIWWFVSFDLFYPVKTVNLNNQVWFFIIFLPAKVREMVDIEH